MGTGQQLYQAQKQVGFIWEDIQLQAPVSCGKERGHCSERTARMTCMTMANHETTPPPHPPRDDGCTEKVIRYNKRNFRMMSALIAVLLSRGWIGAVPRAEAILCRIGRVAVVTFREVAHEGDCPPGSVTGRPTLRRRHAGSCGCRCGCRRSSHVTGHP